MGEQRRDGPRYRYNSHLKSVLEVLGEAYWVWSDDLRRSLACLHLESHPLEDAIEEAWLRLLEDLPALLGEGDAIEHLRPWLFRVARNQALDLIRDRTNHPTQSLGDLSAEPRDQHKEESVDWKDVERQCQGIERWMENVLRESIPRAYRLLCGYRDGETIEQLAAALGCSADAIHALLRRLRPKYRAWAARQRKDETDGR
jgi:RNA polymerase sigma factor (sigma-70 family)